MTRKKTKTATIHAPVSLDTDNVDDNTMKNHTETDDSKSKNENPEMFVGKRGLVKDSVEAIKKIESENAAKLRKKRKRLRKHAKSDLNASATRTVSARKRKAGDDDGKMDVDGDIASEATEVKRPHFEPISAQNATDESNQMRRVPVPNHRYTALKENWMKVFTPIVEHLKLQIRFNLKSRNVEIKSCSSTEEIGALQRAADFVKAFTAGFEVDDALALLRLDDLYVETFDIQDVKPLKGDHLSRAIGRLAGKGGKTKFTIENVTKTRIVLADTRVHILGSFANIQVARRAICNLILGSPPSKVYGNMRVVAQRISERL